MKIIFETTIDPVGTGQHGVLKFRILLSEKLYYVQCDGGQDDWDSTIDEDGFDIEPMDRLETAIGMLARVTASAVLSFKNENYL